MSVWMTYIPVLSTQRNLPVVTLFQITYFIIILQWKWFFFIVLLSIWWCKRFLSILSYCSIPSHYIWNEVGLSESVETIESLLRPLGDFWSWLGVHHPTGPFEDNIAESEGQLLFAEHESVSCHFRGQWCSHCGASHSSQRKPNVSKKEKKEKLRWHTFSSWKPRFIHPLFSLQNRYLVQKEEQETQRKYLVDTKYSFLAITYFKNKCKLRQCQLSNQYLPILKPYPNLNKQPSLSCKMLCFCPHSVAQSFTTTNTS